VRDIYEVLIFLHIGIGVIGLGAFWFSTFSRKRSSFHRAIGNAYAFSMYVGGFVSVLLSSLVLLKTQEIHPDRSESLVVSFNVVLLFLALVPMVTIYLAKSLLDVTDHRTLKKIALRSVIIFSTFGLMTILLGSFLGPIYVTAALFIIFLLVLRLLVCTYRSILVSDSSLVRQKYHTLLAISSGTALHVALFSGGTFVRFFSKTSILTGINFLLPLGIGLISEIVLTVRYNWKLASETEAAKGESV
jgi:hypothetical protein